MDPNQVHNGQPHTTSSTTTTTTHGPHTTTTIHHTSNGQGTTVTHFGPQSTTVTSPTVTTTTQVPHLQPQPPTAQTPSTSPSRLRSSSIRIRRPSAAPSHNEPAAIPQVAAQPANDESWQGNRRRSSSEPRPPSSVLFPDDNDLRREITSTPLQPLYEEGSRPGNKEFLAPTTGPPPSRGPSVRRPGAQRQSSAFSLRRKNHNGSQHQNQAHMESNVVDVLDVIGLYCHIPASIPLLNTRRP